MNNQRVTLKNIYRLLMAADYPVYSLPVISAANRRGITLMRFWQGMLPSEWKSGYYGRLIWRQGGSKNRFSSEFCNRRGLFPYYKLYAGEVLSVDDAFIRLVSALSAFLEEHKYKPENFTLRLHALLEGALREDPLLDAPTGEKIRRILAEADHKLKPKSLASAMALSCLTLLALAGEGAATEDILSVCEKGLDWLSVRTNPAESPVTVLTRPDSLLLMGSRDIILFGREAELFELGELFAAGSKVLLKGPSGIGKTALLCALIGKIRNEANGLRIAAVQFSGSLAQSLVSSFPKGTGTTLTERVRECLFRLWEDPAHTVLFIDNLNPDQLSEEDSVLLQSFPWSVFVTARRGELPGFNAFPVRSVSPTSAALIYRQAVGHPISTIEKEKLTDLIRERSLDFPLMICFLGKLAASHGFTVHELSDMLTHTTRRASSVRHSLRELFQDIYRYAGLSDAEKQLVRLLAALPYDVYRLRQLKKLFPEKEEKEINSIVSALREAGWFTETGDGVSIHPILAESVLTDPIKEEDLNSLLHAVRAILTDSFLLNVYRQLPVKEAEGADDAEKIELLSMAVDASEHLSGPVSPETLKTLLTSVFCLILRSSAGETTFSRILRLADDRLIAEDECRYLVKLIRMILHQESIEEETREAVQSAIQNRKEPTLLYAILWVELLRAAESSGDPASTDERLKLSRKWLETGLLSEDWQYEIRLNTAELLMQRGRYQESREEFLQCAGIAKTQVGESSEPALTALLRAALLSIFLEENEEAEKRMEQAEKWLSEKNSWPLLRDDYNVRTWLCRAKGDMDGALAAHEKTTLLCRKYLGTDSEDYVCAKSLQGTMLVSVGRTAEALAAHEEAIRICRKNELTGHLREQIWNNAAVAYLDAGEDKKAEPLLLEAKKIAEETGGLAVAENAWNRSRVFRIRGELEQEIDCLNACLPVFLEVYGTEHTKTVRAMSRLEELGVLLK